MKIFISGQKYFGQEILRACIQSGHEVIGVCCPFDDKYIGRLAGLNEIKIIAAGSLNYDTMPAGCDLGITAHSFDYIGKVTRHKPKYGWIGYHPSLLPRHRGRSAIEWALRMNDIVTGGTVYWLNSGIDRGDIERQEWIWLDKNKRAPEIWRDQLLPLGTKLIAAAVNDISKGIINKVQQDNKFSTFEPGITGKDIYIPDLLMIDYKAED